jgi:hypothetical protein
MSLEATHELSNDSDNAMRMSRAKQAETNSPKGARLESGDDIPMPNYKLYIYNILELEHEVNQPPAFPRFIIPAKPKDKKFSVLLFPAFIKERYERPGSTEYYFKNIDGRKYASQLLNPASFPGINWQAQLQNWRSNDQFGNNYNSLGCFWSLTTPDDPKLDEEIEKFKAVARKTLEALVRQAEHFYNSKKENEITPLMHFAMDYLRKTAPWHMRSDLMVDCPNCGEAVKEGVAYHRNSFGERCIIDVARCAEIGIFPFAVTSQAAPVPVVPVAREGAGMVSGNSEEDELENMASAGASKEVARTTKGAKRRS